MAKQNIAHGTAAQCGRGSNNDYAEGIHTATSGGKCAGHGFCGDANEIKDVKQHIPSGVNAGEVSDLCARSRLRFSKASQFALKIFIKFYRESLMKGGKATKLALRWIRNSNGWCCRHHPKSITRCWI